MKGSTEWRERAKKLSVTLNQYKYVFLVILVGVTLLLLPSMGGEKKAEMPQETGLAVTFDLAAMEQRLAQVISKIDGAGEAQVVLTLKSSARQIVARDENSSEQENSTTTVVISRGSGTQDAVVLQEIYPQYQGALIVCPGGDKAAVKLKVTEAVAAVTGLGAARISVCKGN